MKTMTAHIPTEDLPFENICGLDVMVEIDDQGNATIATRSGQDVAWVRWSTKTVLVPSPAESDVALVPLVGGKA